MCCCYWYFAALAGICAGTGSSGLLRNILGPGPHKLSAAWRSQGVTIGVLESVWENTLKGIQKL